MTARVPLIACVAVLAFFAGITGIHLAYTLAYVLILLLAVAYVWSRLLARKLRVIRESPQGSFMMGEPFEETFTVKNTSGLRLPYCEVRDGTKLPGYAPGRAFSLAANGSVTWTARGAFNLRGIHHFGPLEARLGDPFGLFPKRIRVAPENEVIVYPALHALLQVVPQWSGNGVAEARRGQPVDVPPDVSTIRDYAPTDGLSRIHWASTARTGRLISRTFDTGQSADLLVVLDLQRGIHAGSGIESSVEYAVSICASVVHGAIRRGQAVGMVTNGKGGTGFGAGRGEVQRLRILDYLALATDDGVRSLAETITRHGEGWRGRGGMVVITANRSSEWVEALVDSATRGQRHLCIFVEPTSFGAKGQALRIPAAWRLALDWWVVRRGDVLGTGERSSATG
ncbi:MAG TPA: DUF58 domain-containing protein [Candidatus Saccharimonadales bacterium]|nr:DUF58 domain-containing protein [Candidatus Saccharimonadales bacterium]